MLPSYQVMCRLYVLDFDGPDFRHPLYSDYSPFNTRLLPVTHGYTFSFYSKGFNVDTILFFQDKLKMASLPSLLNCAAKRSLGPSTVRLLCQTRRIDHLTSALAYKENWPHSKVSSSYFHSSTIRHSDANDQKPPSESTPVTATPSLVTTNPDNKDVDVLVRNFWQVFN